MRGGEGGRVGGRGADNCTYRPPLSGEDGRDMGEGRRGRGEGGSIVMLLRRRLAHCMS